MLSGNAIKELQALYKAQFGIDLSMEEAAEKGAWLLRFYKIVYKPKDTNTVLTKPAQTG